MAETREVQATEAHYGLMVDIEAGRVYDRVVLIGLPETPSIDVPGEEPANVSTLVWQMEVWGWTWRPVDDKVWRLTEAGRAAWEDGGL